MISIKILQGLKNDDGLTLKKGHVITYKSGWQVATEGFETKSVQEAYRMIAAYGGNCGVWFSNGIYYVDRSKRVDTKHEALSIGRACNQISIFGWRNLRLAYC